MSALGCAASGGGVGTDGASGSVAALCNCGTVSVGEAGVYRPRRDLVSLRWSTGTETVS